MPVGTITLSEATQAAIDQALEAKDLADEKDNDLDQSELGLLDAQKAEEQAKDAALEAHAQSAELAHAALAALGAELGFPIDN